MMMILLNDKFNVSMELSCTFYKIKIHETKGNKASCKQQIIHWMYNMNKWKNRIEQGTISITYNFGIHVFPSEYNIHVTL